MALAPSYVSWCPELSPMVLSTLFKRLPGDVGVECMVLTQFLVLKLLKKARMKSETMGGIVEAIVSTYSQ